MANLQKQRKAECREIDCRYLEMHCLAYHGRDCTKQGGTKIPIHRNLNADKKVEK